MFNNVELTDLIDLHNFKCCKFAFVNIRSLPANINLSKADMEKVNSNSLVAVNLSETWLNNLLHDSLMHINGFTHIGLIGKSQNEVVFDSSHKYMLNKLQIAQNKFLKVVYGKKSNLELDQMHKQAKLLKLEDRRRLKQLKTAYKMNKLGYLNPNLVEHKSEVTMRLRSRSKRCCTPREV